MIEKLLKELKEQLSSMQEKLGELELNLKHPPNEIITIEKDHLAEITVINEDRGYIIFKYRECTFVENVNSVLHKGLIEGKLEYIVIKKMEKPSKWNYSFLVTYFALKPTQAAIIYNNKTYKNI